jgi:hypothetical protein
VSEGEIPDASAIEQLLMASLLPPSISHAASSCTINTISETGESGVSSSSGGFDAKLESEVTKPVLTGDWGAFVHCARSICPEAMSQGELLLCLYSAAAGFKLLRRAPLLVNIRRNAAETGSAVLHAT